MNTHEGRVKAEKSKKKKYGKRIHSKWGAEGGKSRKNPYKIDPEKAKEMQRRSVEARRRNKLNKTLDL